jgi:MFS family permease
LDDTNELALNSFQASVARVCAVGGGVLHDDHRSDDVNVSLPTIGRDLHFSETSLQWVVTAYALTVGGLLLLGGRAADLLGRRRILMLGVALFTAASLACGLSTGGAFLIGSRAVQGVGAAIMLPAALSIVMNMFEEGAERNKALGIWGGLGAAGATVGFITGWLLTSHSTALLHSGNAVPTALTGGFQQAFWVLGAIALIALPAIFMLLRPDKVSMAVTESLVGEVRPAPAPVN